MNEDQVIALAGLFQAGALVRQTASEPSCDSEALAANIASVLRIDADSPQAVFGGLQNLKLGLETLIEQIEGAKRDPVLTRTLMTILHLERKLARRPKMRDALLAGIVQVQRQAEHLGCAHATVIGRLAEIYAETLSTFRPRVVVHGSPVYLTQPARVAQIRALLLAAIRAAVLWRQLGGGHWRLLLQRRQCLMVARGLLTRVKLG